MIDVYSNKTAGQNPSHDHSNKGHALIFIPDISGFTHFVNETEVEHSKHIIEELLEVLIEANQLNLEVSEIEGDAILFFKHEDIPSMDNLIGQVERMFLNFHSHLKRYERDRICQCGACSSTINLSIKFVAHSGPVQFLKVKEFLKPYGPGVILAHRLLKNNIPLHEYLLLSGTLAEQEVAASENYPESKSQIISFDHIGEVKYKYLNIGHLRDMVEDPPPLQSPFRINNPITAQTEIAQNIHDIYRIITDLSFRKFWVEAKSVDYNPNEINRAGSKHQCLINVNTLEFEAMKSPSEKAEDLAYAEKVINIPLVDDYVIFFVLSKMDTRLTAVHVEVHYKLKKIPGFFLKPFFDRKIQSTLKKMLQKLTDFSYQI